MVVPTLGVHGGETSPKLQMRQLFKYFLISDYGQSFLYRGNVASLRFIISKHPSDVSAIVAEIKTVLKDMYDRYFTNTTVEVSTVEKGGISSLVIDVTAFKDGNVVTLSDSLTINNLKESFDGNYYNELEDNIKR